MTMFTIRLISRFVKETRSNTNNHKDFPLLIQIKKRFQAALCFFIRQNPAALVTLIPDGFYKLLRQSGLLKEVLS